MGIESIGNDVDPPQAEERGCGEEVPLYSKQNQSPRVSRPDLAGLIDSLRGQTRFSEDFEAAPLACSDGSAAIRDSSPVKLCTPAITPNSWKCFALGCRGKFIYLASEYLLNRAMLLVMNESVTGCLHSVAVS